MVRSFEEGSISLAGTGRTLVMLLKVRVMGVGCELAAKLPAKLARALAAFPSDMLIDED